MDIKKKFRSITTKEPYPHQVETVRYLLQEKSVILRAPTGSGKSEAIIVPFLIGRNERLPSQLIYSLPVRTLVDDLSDRFKGYTNLGVAGHHGKRIETQLFYPPIIVTTIDQTVGSYACTPLSMPLRHGNIPAGAVASALLAFDEIHTFDPERALQSALILAKSSQKLSLPFVFMSATMPDSFIEGLKEEGGLDVKLIDADEKDIPVRRNRKLTIFWKNKTILWEEVVRCYKESNGKVIVVCNTVDRAQKIYNNLTGKVDCELILLHSRFLEEDRKEKEEKLKRIFGKGSKEKGILISTQVIEVGLNISCDIMLTELSPIDSLIQRAGRCARWGGEGRLYVYEVEKSTPYRKDLTDETRDEVLQVNGEKLDWKMEKHLINSVLAKYSEEWLNHENWAKILSKLARAAFERSRSLAENAVREIFSCDVSIHSDPSSIESPYKLERVKLHVGILRKFFNEEQPTLWGLVDNNIIADETSGIVPQEISNSEDIWPYGFYIVHPEHVSYSKVRGLILKPRGSNFGYIELEEPSEVEFHRYKKEGWIEHAKRTLEAFENTLKPRYGFVIKKFAEVLGQETEDFLDKIKTALLLHDLGKLNDNWQRKAGWQEGEEPLAHSGNENVNLPPHAPVTARALSPMLRGWGEWVGEIFYFALAHHHSVGALKVPKYRLIDNWEEILGRLNIPSDKILPENSGGRLGSKLPELSKSKTYRSYVFISRILRLSDRIASGGGENAILRHENWYGNVRC